MYRRLIASSSPELRKWCAYALILLVPGSFVVLSVLCLVRRFRIQAALTANMAAASSRTATFA